MISEKISSVLLFCPGLLLHVSRPVRWDSDHVVILDDELLAIAKELVRSGKLDRIHIGLDYFDASINRVAAWVIGTRNMIKALLMRSAGAHGTLRDAEIEEDFTQRLVMLEELKSLPWAAVWDYYCAQQGRARGRWIGSTRFADTRRMYCRCARAPAGRWPGKRRAFHPGPSIGFARWPSRRTIAAT